MSKYYNARRENRLYASTKSEPFLLSRSKIDLYLNCPRCFYLDVRLGVAQPPGYPFSLNSAVDKLLKKEFDIHRARGEAHPLMKTYGIDAVPYNHKDINLWRSPRQGGISCLHQPTNFLVFGAIDDVWINPFGEIYIVDYKSTAKESEVNIDADWQIGYKRQMEIYQWLFARNNYKVSPTGYFVYANGSTDKAAFDGKLEFSIKILPYQGNFDWVEGVLGDIKKCLNSDSLPKMGEDCDYCRYRFAVLTVEVPNKKSPVQERLLGF